MLVQITFQKAEDHQVADSVMRALVLAQRAFVTEAQFLGQPDRSQIARIDLRGQAAITFFQQQVTRRRMMKRVVSMIGVSGMTSLTATAPSILRRFRSSRR